MIDVICPQDESHHSRLALAYVTQMLQKEDERGSNVRVTRGKLQQLLWESKFYNISTVYGVCIPSVDINHSNISSK